MGDSNLPSKTGATPVELAKKIEAFQSSLNVLPPPEVIKTNQHANGAKYVPIEILEMYMDEIFMGLWKTRTIGQGAKLVGNAVVYDLEVDYYHPTLNQWLTRAGSGACQIQLQATKKDRNGNIIKEGARNALDFERMNASALERNAPTAKAMAFRNAVQSIGKRFGRDLNRDLGHLANYSRPYTRKLNALAEKAKAEAEKLTANISEQ